MTKKRALFKLTTYPGGSQSIAYFVNDQSAQLAACMWSQHYNSWAEVHCIAKGREGIIGQFDKGEPTLEFRHLRPMMVNNRLLPAEFTVMQKVAAIKRYREETGATLQVAKDYVYAHPEYVAL